MGKTETRAVLVSYMPFKNTNTYYLDFKKLNSFFPRWIMGIGGRYGSVIEGSCQIGSVLNGYLHCFNDLSSEGIKYNAEDCPLVKYVGRNSRISKPRISLSPNPVLKDDIVQILGFTPSQWLTVYIFNQYGQLVYQKSDRIDLSGKLDVQQSLPSGVYLLQIVNQNQETYNEKLLVH